ncbi:SNF2 family DNA-dependent chromodomain-containing ATPase [Hortaea werneckii]|nr:SNF2 family DNA-dependent chromodomain-containing ATPase [Hortaea werneckii]KAI6926043.1 SNF2 family DNA-dependent chromodomain-containing ATPase [Hortaea werneckii]KAI6933560.1 SNF2 family DNA-dependent chromodomain-containing ATPase [Hortaea werneckii]KAI6968119.1 SNF2 family DNA-dependent chromodomain-containing ATPase [Hortaea werneckii]KAI7033262.1 SNF2 family DNA-dependent chromodomain-containing ATPase [Hortaea werneckii]
MMMHDSDDDDDLAADPLAAFKAGGPRPSKSHNHIPSGSSTPATAPAPAPAPPTFVPSGSGFTSINRPSNVPTPVASASQSRAEDDADPFAFDANNIPVGDGDSEDEADVVEETRRPVSSTPSAHRVKRSGQTGTRSATGERTRSRQATEEAEHDRGHGHVHDQLIPILPRADSEGNDVDIIDMTAGDDVVRRVLAEADGVGGEIVYKVELGDYSVEEISFDDLLELQNGQAALAYFQGNSPSPSPEPIERPAKRTKMSSSRPSRGRPRAVNFVDPTDALSDAEDGITLATSRRRTREDDEPQYYDEPEDDPEEEEIIEDESDRPRRSGRPRHGERQPSRRSARTPHMSSAMELDEEESEDSDDLLQSDVFTTKKPRLRGRPKRGHMDDFIDDEDERAAKKRIRIGERHSGRATRHTGGMKEVDVNDIYRSDSDSAARAPVKQKVVGAKEVFKPLPRNDEFRIRHNQDCETCGQGPNFAPLIYCQGCSLAYHKSCLGHRTNREHLVTKIADDDCVLQCRRCIAFPKKKDPIAPDQGKCAECKRHGDSCKAFRPRKTPAQEQRDREENGGDDPVYEIHESRINNADNVLFRCIGCWRGFHFEHLPSKSDMMELDMEADAEQRFREYSRGWKCKDCLSAPGKVIALIAWKPVDDDNYDPALAFDMIDEDEKAYLVRWEGMSYFRSVWMPGAWVWGTTAVMMRKAFAKREEAQHPKMRTEDAIPEDFLRTDIVLDIKYTSIVDIHTEEVDKARIREIDKALIKYKGLGYEDAVWEAPPSPDDGDRWTHFVVAYNDWVLGRYVKTPSQAKLKKTMEKIRKEDFGKLEKKAQPENLEGGELMKYQIEGLNWLYYKWFTQKNAILADEMGLGKTIQIIGFLATLVQDHTCWPFLIVVPNATCPNWRREIKRWAPSLRVVAYYGSKESRDLAYRHELFPQGSKDLRCHVVVTSYDAAADENCRKFFRSVPWQGLIVDEGQRLKNDKNMLYSALGALKAPFRILLTGTPLQNNQRELFNLLQFLDDSYKAEELEERFEDLTQEKISELHDMIRPFFLRRTKAQVLTFLPPMSQIIVPVSMSIVQKKLYRSILAKNPDLMKAIFSAEGSLKQGERGSLSNILMQLRKCLCHPFVYSKSIEERNVGIAASHRNLVDASSKLKLLELLLPELKKRGHRVLIFSQFLDMLDIVEDFMEGMGFAFQRLDGSMGALQKQKRIDEYNAPDSSLFAFLLSTRAGGVGINLATADTVIILDPDFNPHQDIQALSRAHRIGQNKKVLCFQLVTRASAEERIMQMGRKKLALDHVLIQEMDADDADQNDLVSVLRHGASELFDDAGDQDIQYDIAGVEKLLDRSHMENTIPGGVDKSAETQWSHARVWANNSAALQDDRTFVDAPEEHAPDPGVWSNILKERERIAAEEAAAKAEAFGRGRRARGNVDYAGARELDGENADLGTPMKDKKQKDDDESDTDFQADDSGAEDEEPLAGEENIDMDDIDVVDEGAKRDIGRKKHGKQTPSKGKQAPADGKPSPVSATKSKGKPGNSTKPALEPSTPTKSKRRETKAQVPTKTPPKKVAKPSSTRSKKTVIAKDGKKADLTSKASKTSAKPRAKESTVKQKKAKTPGSGSEEAPDTAPSPNTAVGFNMPAADGVGDNIQVATAPVIDLTSVRAMLEALKHSNEPEHLVAEAKRYLRALKGNLVQLKKKKEEKERAMREAEAQAAFQYARNPIWQV